MGKRGTTFLFITGLTVFSLIFWILFSVTRGSVPGNPDQSTETVKNVESGPENNTLIPTAILQEEEARTASSPTSFSEFEPAITRMMAFVQPIPYVEPRRYFPNPPRYHSVPVTLTAGSIRDIPTAERPIRYVELNELILLDAALRALSKTAWGRNGSYDWTNVPVHTSDMGLTPVMYRTILEREEQSAATKTIPEPLTKLLRGGTARAEIEGVMRKAYDEYVTFLRARKVGAAYIGILEQVITKDTDRLFYDPDELARASSGNAVRHEDGTQEDYSVRSIEITAASIYNDMKFVMASGIFGTVPKNDQDVREYLRNVRDMTIRINMYHEMTHMLDRAYAMNYSPPEHRTKKSVWTYAAKTLYTLDRSNNFRWNTYDWVNDISVEDQLRISESEADGVAFEAVTNIYDMTDRQKDILWTHTFGRLDPSNRLLSQIKETLLANWPDMYGKSDIGNALSKSVFTTYPGTEAERLKLSGVIAGKSGLAAYAGYFNPMRPEQADAYWKALQSAD